MPATAKLQKPATEAKAPARKAKKAKVTIEVPATANGKMAPHDALCAITEELRWKALHVLTKPMSAQDVAQELGVKPAVALYHLKILVQAGAAISSPLGDYKRRLLFERVSFSATVVAEGEAIEASFFPG